MIRRKLIYFNKNVKSEGIENQNMKQWKFNLAKS